MKKPIGILIFAFVLIAAACGSGGSAGTISFAPNNIQKGNEGAAGITDQFTFEDTVWGRVYLKDSVGDYDAEYWSLETMVDGEVIGKYAIDIGGVDSDADTFSIGIWQADWDDIAPAVFKKKSAGKHTVEITLFMNEFDGWSDSGNDRVKPVSVATGSFEMTK